MIFNTYFLMQIKTHCQHLLILMHELLTDQFVFSRFSKNVMLLLLLFSLLSNHGERTPCKAPIKPTFSEFHWTLVATSTFSETQFIIFILDTLFKKLETEKYESNLSHQNLLPGLKVDKFFEFITGKAEISTRRTN